MTLGRQANATKVNFRFRTGVGSSGLSGLVPEASHRRRPFRVGHRRIQRLPRGSFEWRQIVLQGAPNRLHVNPVGLMTQPIPNAGRMLCYGKPGQSASASSPSRTAASLISESLRSTAAAVFGSERNDSKSIPVVRSSIERIASQTSRRPNEGSLRGKDGLARSFLADLLFQRIGGRQVHAAMLAPQPERPRGPPTRQPEAPMPVCLTDPVGMPLDRGYMQRPPSSADNKRVEFNGGAQMPELVTIPISIFEFAVDYERPQFHLWMERAAIVQGIFDALKPWEPRIDDVDAITTGKASEQGFTIKLPLKRVSFFFGPASCKFTRENVDWQSAEETIAILDAAVSALIRSSGVAMGPKNTAISLHLQPKSIPFIALLTPFIAPQLAALDLEPVMTMAAVAKWGHRKVTIDGSGVLANAVFLRFERDFPSAATYDEIAGQLRKDEEDLFRILGVEEDRA